jgi:hypothetical protein
LSYLSVKINMEDAIAYISFFGMLETIAVYIFDNLFLFICLIKNLITKIRIKYSYR